MLAQYGHPERPDLADFTTCQGEDDIEIMNHQIEDNADVLDPWIVRPEAMNFDESGVLDDLAQLGARLLEIGQLPLEQLDMVLLMSVNPGYGGQSFIPHVLDKARQVREMIDATGKDIRLEIDGGVKIDNIAEIAAAGVDTFVAGSAIFGSADYEDTISRMKANAEG